MNLSSNTSLEMTQSIFNSNSTTSSPFLISLLNPSPPSISTCISNQKLPIAMALNEYIHVWFKNDDNSK